VITFEIIWQDKGVFYVWDKPATDPLCDDPLYRPPVVEELIRFLNFLGKTWMLYRLLPGGSCCTFTSRTENGFGDAIEWLKRHRTISRNLAPSEKDTTDEAQ